jgi:hypothetical protein
MTIPVSSSGDKGDPGDGSIGQTFKGSPLKRIDNASSDDILYILDGLPTSDPKIEGALWMDADRTLKVSSRGFGS